FGAPRLVDVDVGVDETGEQRGVPQIDDGGSARGRRRVAGRVRRDRRYPAVPHGDGGGPLPAGQDGPPRPDHEVVHGHPVPWTMCSGLTGTRVRSLPVASRIAATIAGVDDSVGGSPAPRSP